MVYRRSVHCRWCGDSGHNQRGCPKLKEQARQEPNSYAAQKVAYHASSNTTKRCGYCGETSHNRKTCKKLIVDYSQAIAKNAEYRKNLFQKMCKAGFGIGALVEPRYDNCMAIITEINWDRITYHENSDVIKLDCSQYTHYPIKLEKFSMRENESSYSDYYLTLLSGVSEEMVITQIPEDWFSGKSSHIEERYFPKK